MRRIHQPLFESQVHPAFLACYRKKAFMSVGFAGNPYLRLELKNGDAVSIIFTCVGIRSLMGIFLLSKQRKLTKEWIDAINSQLGTI